MSGYGVIAAYIRVSSKSQDLATQRHAIAQACRQRRVDVDKWFEDVVSSRADVRPGLKRLKDYVRGGLVTELYVWRLDRLSRGTICEVLNLLNEFAAAGCQVFSVADSFPMEAGPFRELVLAMVAWAAHMERQNIADRVSAARERIESQGGKWGRPSQLDEEVIEHIVHLRTVEGRTVRNIAMAVGVHRATVYYHLRRLGNPPPNGGKKPPVNIEIRHRQGGASR